MPTTRTQIKVSSCLVAYVPQLIQAAQARLLAQLDSNTESSAAVRHSLAFLVASIAQTEIPHKCVCSCTGRTKLTPSQPVARDPALALELGEQHQRRSARGAPALRAPYTPLTLAQNGIFCLSTVLDAFVEQNNGEAFSQHSAQLYPLFEKTINDAESLKVRLHTVAALGTMVQYVDSSDVADVVRAHFIAPGVRAHIAQAQLQRFVPSVIGVLSYSLENGHEEGVVQAVDVLESMACADANIFGDHLPAMITFTLQAAGNDAFDDDQRVLVLNLLAFVIR